MRTIIGRLLIVSLFGWLIGLWSLSPAQAFPLVPPQETLGGLTPGVMTIADASRMYGVYDVRLTGRFLQYAGGPRAANAYRWTNGLNGRVPGLIVETATGSSRIEMVVVDSYPGIGTSCGLMTLVPEERVTTLYGIPDYAYEVSLYNYSATGSVFRELFFVDRGLLVVLGQVNGRPNWTVVKLILTYPTYLRNAIAARNRLAMMGHFVEDLTHTYRVWARMAY